MLLWKYVEEEAGLKTKVGVSPECVGRDARGSLVAADYPRHDAARISQLQGISGIVRRNRDEYPGGPPTKTGRVWNHRRGTRSVGWAEGGLFTDGKRNRSGAGNVGNGAMGGGT